MEMADDQRLAPQDPGGGPSMPVEDPDPVAYEPGRGVNGDFAR